MITGGRGGDSGREMNHDPLQDSKLSIEQVKRRITEFQSEICGVVPWIHAILKKTSQNGLSYQWENSNGKTAAWFL